MVTIFEFLKTHIRTYHAIVWMALLGVALVAASGIAESVINIESGRIVSITIVALLVGTFVAVARIPTWLGILFAVSLGAEYLLLFWADLSQPIGSAVTAILSGASPAAHFAEINRSLQVLLLRAVNWWTTLSNPNVIDPLMPQLIWGIGIWLSISFLAWSVWRNQQSVIAILPIGILLGSAAFFTRELYNHMAWYLLFVILLQASSQGLKRQVSWEKRNIDFADALPLDLAIVIGPLSVAIVGIAFLIPSFSINKVAQRVADIIQWDNARSEAVASSFGLQTASNPFTRAGLTGLPRSHLLGNNPDLGSQVVMTIYTGELEPAFYAVDDVIDAPRHYWQSATYDRYNSIGWALSTDNAIAFESESTIHSENGPGRIIRQQVDRGQFASNLLHTSGFPISVNQPIEASYRPNGDMAVATLEGDSYLASSWLLEPEPDALRAASTNYPASVNTYLQLPNSLPDRVRSLALDITTAEPTAYDKALAIEAYLREFPYNLEVRKPPSGEDVADYFLFELQEGYCDYYATSMTVLARAAGLPARFVIGYVTGYYDVEQAAYYVTEAEAHSWAQIYFPGIGWVDFEPTAGRAAIVRENEAPRLAGLGASRSNSGLTDEFEGAPTDGFSTFSLRDLPEVHPMWWLALLVIIGFVLANLDFWRLRFLDTQTLSKTLYERLLSSAKKIGLSVQTGDTPYEFAQKLILHIEDEIPNSKLARFRIQEFWRLEIHPVDEPTYRGIGRLAQIFVRQQFAPPDRFKLDRNDLLNIWEELEPELTRAVRVIRLTHRYPKLFSKTNGTAELIDIEDMT